MIAAICGAIWVEGSWKDEESKIEGETLKYGNKQSSRE